MKTKKGNEQSEGANRRWMRRMVRQPYSDSSIQSLLNTSPPEKKSDADLLRILQYQALAEHYLKESKAALSQGNRLLQMACNHASESHKLCLIALGLSDQNSAESSGKKESDAYFGAGVMSPNGKSSATPEPMNKESRNS